MARVCVGVRAECQDSVASSVVLVVVLHHAFDVEQLVSQAATLFLLSLVICSLQRRKGSRKVRNNTKQTILTQGFK